MDAVQYSLSFSGEQMVHLWLPWLKKAESVLILAETFLVLKILQNVTPGDILKWQKLQIFPGRKAENTSINIRK
jgi:hypothetical protein